METREVVFLVRRPPLGSARFAEAFRMAIGQTACDHRVRILLLEEGVWGAQQLDPERVGLPRIRESLELLGPCKVEVWVEKEALEERGLEQVAPWVQVVPRERALQALAQAWAVISL